MEKSDFLIALVNNFPPKTGIGKYSFTLFERARKDVDLEMVYLQSKDNTIHDADGVIRINQGLHFPVFNKSLSWYFSFPKKIPKGYKLYHLSSQFLARVADFCRPCTVTHMDIAPLHFPNDYPFITRFLLKKVLPFYDKMESIITISQKAKDELVQKGFAQKEKVRVIHLGVDTNLFQKKDKEESKRKLGLPLGKKIILNLGSEEERKNIPSLLNAFRMLQQKDENFLLLRIGNRNKAHDSLKKGLNLVELNKVAEELLPYYYSAADVFVFPATYEGGFAYPPLEAMACGTPTIVGPELDLFKDGAIIVDEPFEERIIQEVEKITQNDSFAGLLSKKGIECAKEFTIEKHIKEMVKFYKEHT